MRLILKLGINAAALWVAAKVISGVHLDGDWKSILLVALVFGLVNVFVKPILKFFSLPALILTLGLFTLVINTALLALTALLMDSFSIDGVVPAFLGALVVSVVSLVLNRFLPDDDD